MEQAQKKSLPQTVVKLTEKIYRKAELEKNAPQMLKAYICREAYQERLTPDSLYTNLKKLESWVESEKNLVNKAILHSLLAREYSDYMRHNRQQLSDRTALDVDEAPADIREWSTNLFVAKVDEHNLASLKDSVCLRSLPRNMCLLSSLKTEAASMGTICIICWRPGLSILISCWTAFRWIHYNVPASTVFIQI